MFRLIVVEVAELNPIFLALGATIFQDSEVYTTEVVIMLNKALTHIIEHGKIESKALSDKSYVLMELAPIVDEWLQVLGEFLTQHNLGWDCCTSIEALDSKGSVALLFGDYSYGDFYRHTNL